MADDIGGITELGAVLGIDVEEKQWDGALELIEQMEKRLKEMVGQASKKLPGPKIPLTDEQEALKILERRAKQQRINSELERIAPKQPKIKAVLTDEQEVQRILDRRAKQRRINDALNKASPKTPKPPKAANVVLSEEDEAKRILERRKRQEKVNDELSRLEKDSRGLIPVINPYEILKDTLSSIVDIGRRVFDTLKGMANETIDDASKIHDLAESTGFSTDALQEMKYAADQSGSSLDALLAGTKRLNTTIEEIAKTGKGPGVDALRKLGLTAAQVKKSIAEGGLESGITLISERLGRIKDPAEKSRVAMALLGKSGQNLIPTLNGLADLRKDARNLGMVIPEDDIDALENFGDQIGRVKGTLRGLQDHIVAALIPTLQKVTDHMLAWIDANRDLIQAGIERAVELIGQAIEASVEALDKAFTWISENKDVIIAFYTTLWHAVMHVVDAVVALKDGIVAVMPYVAGVIGISPAYNNATAGYSATNYGSAEEARAAARAAFAAKQGVPPPGGWQAPGAAPPPGGWAPGGAAGGAAMSTTVNIDSMTVSSPNADPKQVAAAIGPAFQQLMSQQMRTAAR